MLSIIINTVYIGLGGLFCIGLTVLFIETLWRISGLFFGNEAKRPLANDKAKDSKCADQHDDRKETLQLFFGFVGVPIYLISVGIFCEEFVLDAVCDVLVRVTGFGIGVTIVGILAMTILKCVHLLLGIHREQ